MLALANFALRNLLSRPVRSVLSLLGLTVAIAGMVALFAVAEGIDDLVASTLAKVPGYIVMQPGAPIPLLSRLPAAWETEIAAVEGVNAVNAEIWARAHIIEGRKTQNPPRLLMGVDIPSRVRLRNTVFGEALVAGRFLEDGDIGTLNCVISRRIAADYKKQVGDVLKVDGFPLAVIGIYDLKSLLLDVAIVLDINEVRRIARIEPSVVNCFYVEPRPGADKSAVTRRIQDQFRGRVTESTTAAWLLSAFDQRSPVEEFFRGVDRLLRGGPPPRRPPAGEVNGIPHGDVKSAPPVEETLLEVRGAEEWTAEVERFAGDLDVILVIMTGIGVTIAVLSIINTMLMSVTERFIEFGILKANGWSRGDLLRSVTCESGLLGVAGGVLGAGLGWAGTITVNALWPDQAHLYASPGLLAFAVVFSIVLGIVGGLYPAWKAATMLPMDAIRRG